MNQPRYIKWFIKEESVTFEDGFPITCYKLDYSRDESVFDEWALHIRRHYETDDELRDSIAVHSLSVKDYLTKFVIPQKDEGFGSTARSNDITEIIISDILEFIEGYTVPRCKQLNRSGKNQSEHGTDVLAYKFTDPLRVPNSRDELVATEVKAGISSDSYGPILSAVEDSKNYDVARHALTLNYYRKKLSKIDEQQCREIARFQMKSEYNYILKFVASAIISRDEIKNDIVLGIKGYDLVLGDNRIVFLVHGDRFMDLVHEIYARCTK